MRYEEACQIVAAIARGREWAVDVRTTADGMNCRVEAAGHVGHGASFDAAIKSMSAIA